MKEEVKKEISKTKIIILCIIIPIISIIGGFIISWPLSFIPLIPISFLLLINQKIYMTAAVILVSLFSIFIGFFTNRIMIKKLPKWMVFLTLSAGMAMFIYFIFMQYFSVAPENPVFAFIFALSPAISFIIGLIIGFIKKPKSKTKKSITQPKKYSFFQKYWIIGGVVGGIISLVIAIINLIRQFSSDPLIDASMIGLLLIPSLVSILMVVIQGCIIGALIGFVLFLIVKAISKQKTR